MLRRFGLDDTLSLMKHPRVRVTLRNGLSIVEHAKRGLTYLHVPGDITLAGRGEESEISDPLRSFYLLMPPEIQETFRYEALKSHLDPFEIKQLGDIVGESDFPVRLFQSFGQDATMLRLLLRSYCKSKNFKIVDRYLENTAIEVKKEGKGLIVRSGIDLSYIVPDADFRHQWGNILASLVEYVTDTALAKAFNADIYSTDQVGETSGHRIDLALQRSRISQSDIATFQAHVFENGSSVGRALNDGLIDLSAALKIVDKSQRFRQWLDGVPNDANLLREYINAVQKDTKADRLPSKGARFFIGQAVALGLDLSFTGGLATLANATLSAADTFLLDGLIKGWKPNVFISEVNKATKPKVRAA